MFQKEKFSISFKEKYTDMSHVFIALNDTFVFLMQHTK